MAELKYLHALIDDGTNKRVCINDDFDKSKPLKCVGCGEPMLYIPRKNIRFREYFKHKGCQCQKDKYLHYLAQLLIKERFDNKEKPFYITCKSINHCSNSKKCKWCSDVCTKIDYNDRIDLHSIYDTCELESRIVYDDSGNYAVADLMLKNSADSNIDPLLIEIWITHENSEKKRASGLQIIEVRFSNDLEQGQEEIHDFCKLDVIRPTVYNDQKTGYYVRYDNVRFTTEKEKELGMKLVDRAVFYKSRTWFMKQLPCTKIKKREHWQDSVVCEFNIISKKEGLTDKSPVYFDDLYLTLIDNGYKPLKKCVQCSHYFRTNDSCNYYLQERNIYCRPGDYQAETCEHFVQNEWIVNSARERLLDCSIEFIYRKQEPIVYDEFTKPEFREFREIFEQHYYSVGSINYTAQPDTTHSSGFRHLMEKQDFASEFYSKKGYDSQVMSDNRNTSNNFSLSNMKEEKAIHTPLDYSVCNGCLMKRLVNEKAYCQQYETIIDEALISRCIYINSKQK